MLAITRHTSDGTRLTELRYSLCVALHLVGLDSYDLTQAYLPGDGVGPYRREARKQSNTGNCPRPKP